MKIAVVIVRLLVGALLLFASVAYFLELFPQPEMPDGPMKTYNDGLATVHLMTVVKSVELICGILFLAGRYVALSNVVIFPITLNIFLMHAILAPETIASAVFFLLANLFLFYAYRKHYTLIFAAKRIE